MSIFRKSDYGRPREMPKKEKIPEGMKTKYTECPFCSQKGWSQRLSRCSKCGVKFTPEKNMTFTKASDM